MRGGIGSVSESVGRRDSVVAAQEGIHQHYEDSDPQWACRQSILRRQDTHVLSTGFLRHHTLSHNLYVMAPSVFVKRLHHAHAGRIQIAGRRGSHVTWLDSERAGDSIQLWQTAEGYSSID